MIVIYLQGENKLFSEFVHVNRDHDFIIINYTGSFFNFDPSKYNRSRISRNFVARFQLLRSLFILIYILLNKYEYQVKYIYMYIFLFTLSHSAPSTFIPVTRKESSSTSPPWYIFPESSSSSKLHPCFSQTNCLVAVMKASG